MAKKSFSKAPALQFLTRPIEDEEEIVSTASEKEAPSLADFTDKAEDAAKVIIEEATDNSLKEASNKTDSDTQSPAQPVKASENTRQEPPVAYDEEKLPQSYMLPKRKEVATKSKRVQLLMQPKLHSQIKQLAQERGLSFNDFVHQILEDVARHNVRGNEE